MADAEVLKTSGGNPVRVRVPPSAPLPNAVNGKRADQKVGPFGVYVANRVAKVEHPPQFIRFHCYLFCPRCSSLVI